MSKKTSGTLEKESITRVGHSRNDLVDFFGRGLGSKKIHIIQQMYKETWNKNEILAWSYTTLTQTIIQIQMTSYPSLGTIADYTLSVKRVWSFNSGGSRPSDKGVGEGGHPDPEIWGGGSLKKSFFRSFGPQFGLKIRGAGPPDPLDPPLHKHTFQHF